MMRNLLEMICVQIDQAGNSLMKITQQQLREMIKQAVKAKLQEAVTTKKDEIPEEWVAYMAELDTFVKETINKAKELVDKAEKVKDTERDKDDKTTFTKTLRADQYRLVNNKLQFLKNLVTKLSSVDFDQSESYYKGKV